MHLELLNIFFNKWQIGQNLSYYVFYIHASCHRNQEVKDFIIKSKNNYIYILPYHHYMNPIDNFFNQLKYYIKRDEPMSYDLIKKAKVYKE